MIPGAREVPSIVYVFPEEADPANIKHELSERIKLCSMGSAVSRNTASWCALGRKTLPSNAYPFPERLTQASSRNLMTAEDVVPNTTSFDPESWRRSILVTDGATLKYDVIMVGKETHGTDACMTTKQAPIKRTRTRAHAESQEEKNIHRDPFQQTCHTRPVSCEHDRSRSGSIKVKTQVREDKGQRRACKRRSTSCSHPYRWCIYFAMSKYVGLVQGNKTVKL